MAMDKDQAPEQKHCPTPSMAGIALQRSRYFTGKYMAARDFADEQEYLVSRHRLHNRLLHDWGIVSGLEVIKQQDDYSGVRSIKICAGSALDCQGRELLLTEDLEWPLPLPRSAHSQPGRQSTEPEAETGGGPAAAGSTRPQTVRSPFLVGLCYQETDVQFVPVLYAEGARNQTVEANRVSEGVEVVFMRLDQVGADCWPYPPGLDGMPRASVYAQSNGGREPSANGCACGDMVPLALITYDNEHPDEPFEIHTRGRRHVRGAAELPTNIVAINWTHGGEMALEDLEKLAGSGQLRVTFSRPIDAGQRRGAGISRDTFVVQHGNQPGELRAVASASHNQPGLDEDGYVATFNIAREWLREEGHNLAGNLVHIMLKCDFILDEQGNPVDGNHLRGELPTGDGIPGGAFESWFRVAPLTREQQAERRRRHEEARIEAEREKATERRRQEIEELEAQADDQLRREAREEGERQGALIRREQIQDEIRLINEAGERWQAERAAEIETLSELERNRPRAEREAIREQIREIEGAIERRDRARARRLEMLEEEANRLNTIAEHEEWEEEEVREQREQIEQKIAASWVEIAAIDEEAQEELARLAGESAESGGGRKPRKKGRA